MLTEEQKTQRLKCAREILKTYKGCNSRVISNLLTGDETWVHMFEPQRRADNKQWKRKDQKRPCIAKRTIISKNMLYAIFFNSSGPAVQVPCSSGHTVTGRFYKNSVLKKMKEFYNKKQPSKGWSGVHLLHDNASSHKCEVVKCFLISEKVKVLNHPPYSPETAVGGGGGGGMHHFLGPKGAPTWASNSVCTSRRSHVAKRFCMCV